MGTHRCTRCGEEKPVEQFIKYRARLAGKAYASGEWWCCDPCKIECKRDWLNASPENRERDRVYSRRWKDRNREANRARDRAYSKTVKPPCPKCGTPMDPNSSRCQGCRSDARERRWREIERMWADGRSMREIADAVNTSVASLGVDMARMRRAGRDVPYRYRMENGRRVA